MKLGNNKAQKRYYTSDFGYTNSVDYMLGKTKTLIKGVNDHRQHARDLAILLECLPCKINLIPFNPFSLSDYERPTNTSVSNFRQILQEAGYTVTVRTTRADDIGAACGQLVGDVVDQTLRSDRHKKNAKPKIGKVFDRADNLAVTAERI